MVSANERRRYNVTSPLIGWAHIQIDPDVSHLYNLWPHMDWDKTLHAGDTHVADLCSRAAPPDQVSSESLQWIWFIS